MKQSVRRIIAGGTVRARLKKKKKLSLQENGCHDCFSWLDGMDQRHKQNTEYLGFQGCHLEVGSSSSSSCFKTALNFGKWNTKLPVLFTCFELDHTYLLFTG